MITERTYLEPKQTVRIDLKKNASKIIETLQNSILEQLPITRITSIADFESTSHVRP